MTLSDLHLEELVDLGLIGTPDGCDIDYEESGIHKAVQEGENQSDLTQQPEADRSNKRAVAKKLKGFKVSVVDDVCYLEKE